MPSSDGYGQRFGELHGVTEAPALVTRALRATVMAVTEVRCDHPLMTLSGPLKPEDAFLVGFLFRDFLQCKLWEDGRLLPARDLRAQHVTISDLKRGPGALLDHPYHAMFFYLPRSALNSIADDANSPRIGGLNCKADGIEDPTIASLAKALLPALRHPDQASQLFLDHVLFAVGGHAAQFYGGMRPHSQPAQGGLAPWQLRRAKEILSANLDGRVALEEVARDCHLSVSYFSRAFRQSMGTAPHQWLLAHRVEVAKEKLRDERLSLLDVALACGFADQSHLTRVFTRIVGISPGAWRRALDD
jgi:AraC family transcriptional regulator